MAAGISAVEELAISAGCDARALHDVLDHLVGKGVFEEPAPGRFALNDAARALLARGPANRARPWGHRGRFAHAWSTLLDYVRSGAPAYDRIFGLPFWEDLDAHPEMAASFDALIGPTGWASSRPPRGSRWWPPVGSRPAPSSWSACTVAPLPVVREGAVVDNRVVS